MGSKLHGLAGVLAAVATVLAGEAEAASNAPSADEQECVMSAGQVANRPEFKDFPAAPWQSNRFAKPKLTSANARLFRTMLRRGAERGPNFAGHYRIAGWGCGTACSDMGIVDERSGRVFFDDRLRGVDLSSADYAPGIGEDPDGDYRGAAAFRLDSRLLMVTGKPYKAPQLDGVAFYEWTGDRLKLLKFAPKKQTCEPEG